MKNKKAIQYIRISQKDQSHFSIEGQQETNLRYAERHGIEIIRTYIDDGESARDFERPSWKKLMKDLEANKKTIDYLVVMKYDRLIRNAAQGLLALEKIERRWHIKVLSAQEHLSIDPHSPFFFKMRADMLVNAEFERLVISDRSKFGVWRAKSEGRFIGHAPFGYINARDEKNKPIILVDPSKEDAVKNIFESFLKGIGLKEIMRQTRDYGFSLKGHDAVKRILINPVYAGLIEVPAYKDEPQIIVDGIHQSIIPKFMHYQAKDMLIKPQQKHTTINDEVPLRGIVKCTCCGSNLTAGKSKGKLKHYWYYVCNSCRIENISADKAHATMQGIMANLSLTSDQIAYILDSTKDKLKEYLNLQTKKESKLRSQREQLMDKINSLEEKYIGDMIEAETYRKWSGIFRRDLAGMDIQLKEIEKGSGMYFELLQAQLPKLNSLEYLYLNASTIQKQELIRYIFSENIELSRSGYRTPHVMELFSHNVQNIKGISIKEKGTIRQNQPYNSLSTRNGTIIEHPNSGFIQLISKIA
jgi:site-specific DNA recombinase